MKASDKVSQALKRVVKDEKARSASVAAYPDSILGTVIYHRLHLSSSAESALASFGRLSAEFVDWNEIRVSTIQEIREHLPSGGDSLDTAVFIKDFLEFVHRERQCMDLQYLVQENLSDVRRFLKQVRGIDAATIDLLVHRYKEHPIFPLNPATETILVAAGLAKQEDTRDRKGKAVFEMLEAEAVLPFHHFLLDLHRELQPADEAELSGARPALRDACGGFVKGPRGNKGKKARTSRAKNTEATRGTTQP